MGHDHTRDQREALARDQSTLRLRARRFSLRGGRETRTDRVSGDAIDADDGVAARFARLPEREGVRLRAALEERDLQRSFANLVVLAHELVHAAVLEHAVSVVVDVDAV
jgi:hypothetical protein